MAFKKLKVGAPPGSQQMNAKLKRHFKEKARRERLLRQKPPGVKERFVSERDVRCDSRR